MELSSSAFNHGGVIPKRYTCDGENISPPLMIKNVPPQTKSLVLIMNDPDVPLAIRPDGLWNHWLAWNIPPDTTEILEDHNPPGSLGKNTRGAQGYSGPCPPDREHRYFFKLYALDSFLELAPDADEKTVERALEGRVIAHAQLMGRYNKIINQ